MKTFQLTSNYLLSMSYLENFRYQNYYMPLQAILSIIVLSNIGHGGTMSDIGGGVLASRHGQFSEGWCHGTILNCGGATCQPIWRIFGSPPWSHHQQHLCIIL
jgi:hypothetical protein